MRERTWARKRSLRSYASSDDHSAEHMGRYRTSLEREQERGSCGQPCGDGWLRWAGTCDERTERAGYAWHGYTLRGEVNGAEVEEPRKGPL